MDYENRYKEALDRAEKNYKTAQNLCEGSRIGVECFKNTLKSLFPELKESEDERIKKKLIKLLRNLFNNYSYFIKDPFYTECINWLEKQGEQEDEKKDDFTIYYPLKNGKGEYECIPYSFYGTLTSFSENSDLINFLRNCFYTEEECEDWIEKQGEPNPYSGTSFKYDGHTWGMCARDNGVEIIFDGELKAFLSSEKSFVYPIHPQPNLAPKSAMEVIKEENVGNPEPKFKVGDWITDGNITIQIEAIKNDCYLYCGDCALYSTKTADKVYHLWSIKDAKPGDVLVDSCQGFNNPFIFILKKFETVDFGLTRPSDFSSYCYLTMSDKQKFKEGAYHHMHDGIKPAAKEQRGLLFQKMKEEGYEWDAEKKELNKIEQSKLTEFEDEKMFMSLHNLIYVVHDCDCNSTRKKELSDWFESLKKRYTWKPSDEQIEAIRLAMSFVTDDFGDNPTLSEILIELEKQLKKLKGE